MIHKRPAVWLWCDSRSAASWAIRSGPLFAGHPEWAESLFLALNGFRLKAFQGPIVLTHPDVNQALGHG